MRMTRRDALRAALSGTAHLGLRTLIPGLPLLSSRAECAEARSLHDILSPTLVRTADPSASMKLSGFPPHKKRVINAVYPWSYELEYIGNPGLIHLRHGAGVSSVEVCERIKWNDVLIYPLDGSGYSFVLPLQAKYLIGHYVSKRGYIDEGRATRIWPYPMRTDQSFSMVYGFELMNNKIEPLSAEVFKDDDFFGKFRKCVGENFCSAVTSRYLVCIEFVCCVASNDFEPSERLTVNRIFPLVWVMSNVALDGVTASITIKRPTISSLTGQPLVSALFADRNEPDKTTIPQIASLYWDNLFDYYYPNPKAGEYIDVAYSDQIQPEKNKERYGGNRLIFDGKKYINNEFVHKLPRQAEFDNIHIAPQMMVAGTPVIMAPICAHDCLHTHFRWGARYGFGSNILRGWCKSGAPNICPGEPMVPTNQRVTLIMNQEINGFTYAVTAFRPNRNDWTIINHHGSAYARDESAFSSSRFSRYMISLTEEVGWPYWYHTLRYEAVEDYVDGNFSISYRERVQIINTHDGKDGLRFLRKL